jgi:hypothetical protein
MALFCFLDFLDESHQWLVVGVMSHIAGITPASATLLAIDQSVEHWAVVEMVIILIVELTAKHMLRPTT